MDIFPGIKKNVIIWSTMLPLKANNRIKTKENNKKKVR